MSSYQNIKSSPNDFQIEACSCCFDEFQQTDYQYTYISKTSIPFTGKELDSETGYSYFGARYYDAELSGLFFSVDLMVDKYPQISPYNYCMWNPVKMVDPDGCKLYFYDDVTSEKVKGYMRELFGTDKLFSYNRGFLGINKRQFNHYYKNASHDQRFLLDGLRTLIERPELATIKIQNNDECFEFKSFNCSGSIRAKCTSGFTSEKPIECLGYIIAVNDKGLDQQIEYSTGLYILGGSDYDIIYPLTTRTTAASTFIHETLDELLNRSLLGNVSQISPNREKIVYQNAAQRVLDYYERDGSEHHY